MSRRSLSAAVAIAIRQAYRAAITDVLVEAGYSAERSMRAARRLVRNRNLSIREALA